MNTLVQQALRSAAVLALFAAVGGGILAGAHQLTASRIAENERAVLLRQLNDLLPPDSYDNALFTDTISIELPAGLSPDGADTVYRARRGSKPVAVILPVTAPNGYNGAIDMLVGIRYDGTIAAVRVVRHRETPGLGDGIEVERADWIHQFADRSLERPQPRHWRVRKDGGEFDQLTGATITPRAVVAAVQRALNYHENWRDALYEIPEAPSDG